MEEEKGCVYVHSNVGLWRFRFDGEELQSHIVTEDKGEVTQIICYRHACLPLCSAAFKWNSKLFLVGGEKLRSDDDPVEDLPTRKWDWVDEEDEAKYVLNKLVYDLYEGEGLGLPKPSDNIPQSAGPKPWPLVVPIKTATETRFYVFARMSWFYPCPMDAKSPVFEVYDPQKNVWETPEQPPSYMPTHLTAAFELAGKIVLLSPLANFRNCQNHELSFDIATGKWKVTDFFAKRGEFSPMSMTAVEGLEKICIGSDGSSIYAYKWCEDDDLEDDQSRIAVQELTEVSHYCGPYWSCKFPAEVVLTDMGNGEVLYLSATMDSDSFVHYYALKFHVHQATEQPAEQATEQSAKNNVKKKSAKKKKNAKNHTMKTVEPCGKVRKPFVKAEVMDCCHKKVTMKDAREICYQFGLCAAFVL